MADTLSLEAERAAWEAWAVKERKAYRDDRHGLCFYNASTKPASREAWEARATVESELLAEVLALAECGVSHGLLADDYCSQIVAKLQGRAATKAAALPHVQRYTNNGDGTMVENPDGVWCYYEDATKAAAPADAPSVAVPVEAYLWLMGLGRDGFVEDRDGAFWWRSAFNDRAGLDMIAIYQASKGRATSVPAIQGTKVVPITPTLEMVKAGDATLKGRGTCVLAWRAMVDAAPSHPLEAKAGEFRCADYDPDDHDSCQFDRGNPSICQRCGVERAKAGEDA